MFLISRRLPINFLLGAAATWVLLFGGVEARPDVVGEVFEPWMHRLNEAYLEGEANCDFTLFLDVVGYYAAGGEPHVQERVLDWLATFDQRLPSLDAEAAYASILPKLTDARLVDRAKQLSGLLELRSARLKVRQKVYLQAIAARFSRMPNGAPINYISAMQEAAYDGVDEAGASLERMTVTSAGPWKTEQLSPFAEVTLWYLRLRSGALNRDDARRLHLSRLLAMPVEEFHWGMIGNSSFRLATIGTIDDTCYRARSSHCGLAAALYDKWVSYLHQLPEAEEIEILTGPVVRPVQVGQVLTNLRGLISGVIR